MAEGMHVGYILKQYPRLSETFVLNEILGLEEQGIKTSIHSLRHATEGRFHPAIGRVRGQVRYVSDVNKASFLDAIRALPRLQQHRLPEILEFLDHLPEERRARLLLNAIDVAESALDAGVNHLHAHFLTVAAQTAYLVSLLTGLPYSITAHAKDIYRTSVDWELAGRLAGAASTVVTVCDANLRFLAHRLDGANARLVRIYNGLGSQRSSELQPPAESAVRQSDLVLGVGRMVEKKGFDLLIESIALLSEHQDVRCVLVGDGERRAALEAQATMLGIADRVTFAGALGQDEVARWLDRASLLAAPCRVGGDGNQDALPTVLLEALQAGVPAISTPVGGIEEIVTHGQEGLIVPTEDPQALADAIGSLLANPQQRVRFGIAGQAKVAKTFDQRVTIEELIDVFYQREPVR
ncbi:MAG: glycosyltransferase family 4 protein [Acidimicrobiales bacterium]